MRGTPDTPDSARGQRGGGGAHSQEAAAARPQEAKRRLPGHAVQGVRPSQSGCQAQPVRHQLPFNAAAAGALQHAPKVVADDAVGLVGVDNIPAWTG